MAILFKAPDGIKLNKHCDMKDAQYANSDMLIEPLIYPVPINGPHDEHDCAFSKYKMGDGFVLYSCFHIAIESTENALSEDLPFYVGFCSISSNRGQCLLNVAYVTGYNPVLIELMLKFDGS